MVFQSCFPTVLGLLFTTWAFTPDTAISFASAGVAFLATVLIFGNMLRTGHLSAWMLLVGGPLYLIYVFLALFTPLGAGAAPLRCGATDSAERSVGERAPRPPAGILLALGRSAR
jgi:hypothetical protein